MRVGAELRLLQGVVVVPVVVVVLVGDLHYTACVPAPLLLLLGDGFAVGPVLVRSLAPMSLHVDAARLLVAHLLRQAFAVRDRGEPPGVFRGFGEKTRLLLLLEQPAPDPGLGDSVGVLRGGRVVPVVHGIRGGGRVVPVVVVVDVHDTARELAPLLPPLRLVLRDGFAVGPVLVRPPAPLGGLDAARLLLAVLLPQPLAERDGRELTGGRRRTYENGADCEAIPKNKPKGWKKWCNLAGCVVDVDDY